MKITRRYIRKLISEYKKESLNEYSMYESNEDLADHMEDISETVEAVVEKYVYSGWLTTQDQRFLAEDLEGLSEMVKRITDKVSRMKQ